MTVSESDPQKRTQLTSHGVEIHDVAAVGGTLWLPSIMETLVSRGITRLLVEGGPRIWRAFADAALVDEVILYMAGAAPDDEALAAVARQHGPVALSLVDRQVMGTDTMWRLHRVTPKEGH
jgi:diaminohydroxyphosphoribosylaminopyrimidine deaminase/5-amino-6-(5-phosphoribosylamino)uracil reductase